MKKTSAQDALVGTSIVLIIIGLLMLRSPQSGKTKEEIERIKTRNRIIVFLLLLKVVLIGFILTKRHETAN